MSDSAEIISELKSRLARFPAATHPVEHAAVRFNLGLATAERPDGDRVANLHAAIGEYAQALAGFDPDRQPRERARVLMALGAAESELGLLIQARDRYTEAVDLLDVTRTPGEWGAASNGLGLVLAALREREAAISAYRAALDAFGSGYPRQRATCLYNLGLVLAQTGAVSDLEAACACYEEALSVLAGEPAGYVAGAVHNALGLALMDLPGDRLGHLTRAVESFREALEVFTRRSHPFQHALAKNNLGVAYEELAVGDDPVMLRRAMVSLEDALGILDYRLHRELWSQARVNLDRVERRLAAVAPGRTRAEHFVELLSSVSGPELRALLRYRLPLIYSDHDPTEGRAFDEAIAGLDSEAMSMVTRAWLSALMEQSPEVLDRALRSRQDSHAGLDGERLLEAQNAIEDALGELEILQRVRVRDMLIQLGYERPESR